VQDFHAANVASLAQTATTAFLNTIAVSRSGAGKGTVTSVPGGIICGTTCSHGFPYGTSVTLTANATKGSRFRGWTGACTGTGGCTITTDGNTTVAATFVLRPCIVPKLKGRTLKAARNAIRKAFCSVGKVRKAASSTVKKGRVISQKPKPGRHVKQHTRVDLVVSKG
jgi:hypothetical protein